VKCRNVASALAMVSRGSRAKRGWCWWTWTSWPGAGPCSTMSGLVAGKRGPTRLWVALLLKFYARAGRFPRGQPELDDEAMAFVARQVGVPTSDLSSRAGLPATSGRTRQRRHPPEMLDS
jgi:hypothetical protein